MAYSIEGIVKEAKKQAQGATEEILFAKIGAMSSDIPFTGGLSVHANMLGFKTSTLSESGKKLFKKFEKEIKKAVCDDFKYCGKRQDVKDSLDKYLPDIVKALLKRLPKTTSKLPEWIITVLKLFKVSVASWDGLIVLFVAYLLVKGLDEFCGCK